MKTLPIFLLTACLFLGIASCNLLGDSDGSPVTAVIDGEDWNSVALTSTFVVVDSSFLTITGTSGGLAPSSIILQVLGYEGEGTYDLADDASIAFANYLPNILDTIAYSTSEDGSSGMITITDDNDEFAEGTFSFIAAGVVGAPNETVEVTEGQFKIDKP